MRKHRRPPAFTLLEVLVVMWALGFLFLLGAAILAGALKMQRAGTEAQDHFAQRSTLADLYRADVHQATAAPDRAEEWTAGPTCLILQAHTGSIVYRWNEEELERIALPGRTTQRLPLGSEHTTVEFLRPATDRPVVTLRLKQTWPKTASVRTHDIAAALGGDLR